MHNDQQVPDCIINENRKRLYDLRAGMRWKDGEEKYLWMESELKIVIADLEREIERMELTRAGERDRDSRGRITNAIATAAGD